MNPALEHDVNKWLSKLSSKQIKTLRTYLDRIVNYGQWFDDFGRQRNGVPHERLIDVYFDLGNVHEAFELTVDLYSTIFDEPELSEYTKLEHPTAFYLEGKPYVADGTFWNVYSLPCKEIIELIDKKHDGSYKIGIWRDGTVAVVGYKDDPFCKPSTGIYGLIMQELINNFGGVRLSAKALTTAISEKVRKEGKRGLNITPADVSSFRRDINKQFKKSKLEEDLILGGSGFAFNRRQLPLVLMGD